jgi:GIY-YIG catalytic domain-containing protein
MTLLRPDWIQETWDMFYGREDALRGGISPEEYARFVALEAPVRAAVVRGARLRQEEERARAQAEWQDAQDERDRLAEEHAARTAHLLDCWPGLLSTRGVPMCAGVYVIRHVPSGREYVGQSCRIRDRWSTHLKELRRPYRRHHAAGADWEADGPQAFEWEIVEVVGEPEPPERLSPDELRTELLGAERRWIEERQPAYNR